ncbi:MAG: phosphate/phosphite/phosphonate ABC transporter substrate-binding protein [Burkholderiales bacterium]|nr:phosphate/phosphite/phosphonate ABC transporter substrate-binding protein [Burkholderiales bacterium]
MRALLLLFLCLSGLVAEAQEALLLGVNDGTAGQQDYAALTERYQPLADYLAKLLKKPVRLESSQNLKSSTENLLKGRYALFFAKPSNVAAQAMAKADYDLVAAVQGAFTVKFITRADSGFKKPEDIRGHRIAYAEGTFMEKAGITTLRDLNLLPKPSERVKARYQDAIAYIVEQRFADVGMVSPIVAKQWEARGGVTLFESRKLPYWSLIASPKLSPAEKETLRAGLLNAAHDPLGQKVLKSLDIKGFEPGDKKAYLDMLAWLESR